ncbi:MAG: HAD-IC family P-type ATPase, partial [archaeon]|nr:HAD-IC family P-type ATPase [archaeon]
MVNWHSIGAKELLKRFDSKETGLSEKQVEKRIAEFGENRIEIGKKVSIFELLVEQFTSPLVLMLFAAALFSFLFEKGIDGILILSIVIANGLFGFLQDYNAEKSIEALKKLGSPRAFVYRDGTVHEIDSARVVPGDIILLKEGIKVPADARIIESDEIEADESILTGESNPVAKKSGALAEGTVLAERTNMLFMDTLIVRGRGKAIVVETGKGTEVGKIASTLQAIQEQPTKFHREIEELSKKIGSGVIVLIVAIGVTLYFVQSVELIEVIFTSVSLAVAAIPEGLPAVVTLSLAIATGKMLKKKSLVRKLSVIETLGSVDVICTDKTGTLTENSMTVQEIYFNGKNFGVSGSGRSIEGEFLEAGKKVPGGELKEVLLCGLACNDTIIQGSEKSPEFLGDPTEVALTVSALKGGISLEGMKRTKDIPFSSIRRRMTTVYDFGAKVVAYSKGAPEVIIESCDRILLEGKVKKLGAKEKQEILAANNAMASGAMRVLGFAHKELDGNGGEEEGMVFLGLQAMIDPPRKEVSK